MTTNEPRPQFKHADELLIEARQLAEAWEATFMRGVGVDIKAVREAFVRGYLRGYRNGESERNGVK